MKWIFVFLYSNSLMASYSTVETQELVEDLKSFQDEIETPKKSKTKKKGILTLSEILNRNSTKSKEVANNSNVMDLDAIFDKVKSKKSTQTQPGRVKRRR